MKNLVMLFVLAFAALGCEDPSHGSRPFGRSLDDLTYAQDTRTSPPLCFAYFNTGGHGGPALATVPCEAVEGLITRRIPAANR